MSIDEAIEQFKYNAECNRADLDISYAEENEQIAEWLEELKEYQQYKKQGFLVLLPCKPGTIVYAVYKITVGKRSNQFLYDIDERAIKLEDIDCIGEYVFFTREAALNKITSLRAKKH